MSFDFTNYRRAHKSIAQGSLTNSKRVETLIKGVSPTHVTHGNGPYLYDDKKHEYLDFICGLGSQLFGYGNTSIVKAVAYQLDRGTVFSLGSTLELKAAEELLNLFPFSRKLRFLKTGTEATMAALRIARAHTGRMKVLSDGYHGWSDEFVSLTEPALGVPHGTFIEKLQSLDQITEDIAAVIVEPVIIDHSSQRIEFLVALRDRCSKTGTLVIFDEIITGFRWPKFSVANETGVKPDIMCLGKAIGGGLPLSAVLLGEGIGDNSQWFVSSTFAGDVLALSAFCEVKKLLFSKFDLNHLWSEGQKFQNEFNSIAPNLIRIDGYPTRGVFVGEAIIKALFFQECHKARILVGPSFFFGFQHIEIASLTIGTFRDVLNKIRTGNARLEGEMPVMPFSQKVRGPNDD